MSANDKSKVIPASDDRAWFLRCVSNDSDYVSSGIIGCKAPLKTPAMLRDSMQRMPKKYIKYENKKI